MTELLIFWSTQFSSVCHVNFVLKLVSLLAAFSVICICVFLQRAAQQLKAQRQLEEAFESRLQRMQTNIQTNMQTSMQPVTLVSSDTTLSTDTNPSSSK